MPRYLIEYFQHARYTVAIDACSEIEAMDYANELDLDRMYEEISDPELDELTEISKDEPLGVPLYQTKEYWNGKE